ASIHGRSILVALLGVGLLELFGLVIRGERFENGVELSIHNEIQLMERQADAVIGDAVLREVVGANFLAAVAAASLSAPLRSQRCLLLFQLQFVQPGAEHALGLGAVLDLGFFV